MLHLLDVPPRDNQGDDLGIRPDSRKRVRAAEAADDGGIRRVEQLAERREVTMTEISLAWLLTKTASPVVGATKLQHIEEMVGAAELSLSEEEIAFLEEAYVPHKLVGVMAQNTMAASAAPHVWSVGNQKI